MLPPVEFGTYLATGTEKRAHEHAIYFELSRDFQSDYFNLQKAVQHCKPHPDGRPKHSVYVSTYRVLEHVPLSMLQSLWLTTRDGRILELKQAPLPDKFSRQYHLYQELCPVHPLIASSLNPIDFCRFITDPDIPVSVPKICFLELQLGELAENPDSNEVHNLPYENMEHLRQCLRELPSREKTAKTVNRIYPKHVPYRVVESGFFVGHADSVLYYPFPSAEQMQKDHYMWWRSATLS